MSTRILKQFEAFTIWTDDNYKDLSKWYQDTFNLKVATEIDIPNDNAIALEIDPANEMYLWIGYHSEVTGKNKDPRRLMISFWVDDVYEVEKVLVEKDVVIIANAQQSPDGTLNVLTIEDPDGNTINLYSKI